MKSYSVLSLTLALVLIGPVRSIFAHEHMPQTVSVSAQPAAHLVVGEPLARLLSAGLVLISFKTENLKVVPVYGETASQVTPRIGHLHITVDDGPWHWLHASDEPVIIQGLSPGSHRVLMELADANHKVIEARTVTFDIPQRPVSH